MPTKVRIYHQHYRKETEDVTVQTLVERAGRMAARWADDEEERSRLRHDHLCGLVGNLFEHLLTRGVITVADLPELFGDLGDYEIVTETEG